MGIFGNLFRKKEEPIIPVDLSVLKTDIHSHLLPGLDDGSETIDESIDLIKKLYELGYKKAITSPHIISDFYKNTPEIILNKLNILKGALKNAGIEFEIEACAEYLVDDGLEKIVEKNEILTFGKNFILIELSLQYAPNNLKKIIFDLQINGYKVVLAHPERYLYWVDDFKKFEEMKDRDVFFQMNIISLSGYYSPLVKKLAEKMITHDMIDFLGTDLHHVRHLNAIRNTLQERYLENLFKSGKLLNHTL